MIGVEKFTHIISHQDSTGRPSDLTHLLPLVCVPSPHVDPPFGVQLVQAVRIQEKFQQVCSATQGRVSSMAGQGGAPDPGCRRTSRTRLWRDPPWH